MYKKTAFLQFILAKKLFIFIIIFYLTVTS